MRTLLTVVFAAGVAAGQVEMNQQFPAFRIAGNLYYVGTNEIACYLVTTNAGHILINSGYATTPALITNGIEQLGLRVPDIRYLLASHAGPGTTGGHLFIHDMTRAKIWSSKGDGPSLLQGGEDPRNPDYLPVDITRFYQDGDVLEVGGVKLVAHLTPGVTKGCTTWTLQVKEHGRVYDVVIVGGAGVVPGMALKGNAKYPNIAVDYVHTFQVLRSLKCDIFLSARSSDFGLQSKYELLKNKPAENPFVDPAGYAAFIDRMEKVFQFYLGNR